MGAGALPLIGAVVCFAIFLTNVALGAARAGVFFGDVGEMLMLFAAAILFVVGIVAREKAAGGPR